MTRRINRQRNRWGGGAALPPVEPVDGQQQLEDELDSHDVVAEALLRQRPDPNADPGVQTTEAGPDVDESEVQRR